MSEQIKHAVFSSVSHQGGRRIHIEFPEDIDDIDLEFFEHLLECAKRRARRVAKRNADALTPPEPPEE